MIHHNNNKMYLEFYFFLHPYFTSNFLGFSKALETNYLVTTGLGLVFSMWKKIFNIKFFN